MISAHPAQGESSAVDARGSGAGPHDNSWIFDVDGCLIDSLTGSSLRPGARDLLAYVKEQARVYVWSAGGDDYARDRAAQFGLDDLVDGYFAKGGRDGHGRYVTAHLPLGAHRTVFVDDRPEDLGGPFEVLAVSPYLVDDRFDRGLESVRAAASTMAEPGRRARQNLDNNDNV